MRLQSLRFSFALLACAIAASPAVAAPISLVSGGAAVPLGIGNIATDIVGGFTVVSGPQNLTLGPNGNGTTTLLTIEAIRETLSGTIDFFVQERNNSTGGAAAPVIASLGLTNYTTFTVSVDNISDVPTGFAAGSTIVAGGGERGSGGGTVIFDFGPFGAWSNFTPGTLTNVMLVKTSATGFDSNGGAQSATVSTGGIVVGNVLEPIVPTGVPEPGTLVLGSISGALGLLTLGARRLKGTRLA